MPQFSSEWFLDLASRSRRVVEFGIQELDEICWNGKVQII